MIKRAAGRIAVLIAALLLVCICGYFARAEESANPIRYGENAAAGAFAEVNGIRLYYEIYGKGQPLVLLHANGGNIMTMSHQIYYFSKSYRVIAIDSRGHGKSGRDAKPLDYELMASDVVALMDELKIASTHIVGWSDGGILGLLIASQHPKRVAKLAIMGANLNPKGAHDWAQSWVAKEDRKVARMIKEKDSSRDWEIYQQQLDLMGKQPNIPIASLKTITAPTLVMAGDKDIIRGEHTQLIFDSIPKAQLCIFPGATHMIPVADHGIFNACVGKFLKSRFIRPESKDFMR